MGMGFVADGDYMNGTYQHDLHCCLHLKNSMAFVYWVGMSEMCLKKTSTHTCTLTLTNSSSLFCRAMADFFLWKNPGTQVFLSPQNLESLPVRSQFLVKLEGVETWGTILINLIQHNLPIFLLL